MPHQDDPNKPNEEAFQRQRENKQPITNVTGRKTNILGGGGNSRTVKARNYKCPACGGEFQTWDKRLVNGPKRSEVCPFCNLERGQYDPDEEQE